MDKQMVIKSNVLVEASYRLSSIEQKIILILATKIKKDDKEFREYYFNLRSMANFLGLNSNSDYEYLREVTKNLLSKVIEIKTEDALLQTHWLESVKYFDNNSTVELRFNPELKPFLLQLKKNFTKYQLKFAIQLKSKFSIRIYELLKQYEGIGSRLLCLEDLRKYLGIRADEYSLYSNFKNKVLKVAKKELNAKTDISFDFLEIKTGRKVTDIKIVVTSDKAPGKPSKLKVDINEQALHSLTVEKHQSNSLKDLISLLPTAYQPNKSIEKILSVNLEQHGYDYVMRNILYTNEKSNAVKNGSNITKGSNYRVYLSKALKADYGLAYQEEQESQNEIARKQREAVVAKEKQQKQEIDIISREREAREKARAIFQSYSEEKQRLCEEQARLRMTADGLVRYKKKDPIGNLEFKRRLEDIIIENENIQTTERESSTQT